MSTVYVRSLYPLRVEAEGGLKVRVCGGMYEVKGQRRYYRGETGVDLTDYVPQAGKRRVLVYLDVLWNKAKVEAAPATVGFPLYPPIPANGIALAYILLEAGDTSLRETDIEEARVLFEANQGCDPLPCTGG